MDLLSAALMFGLWTFTIWYSYSLGRLHGVAAGLREARRK